MNLTANKISKKFAKKYVVKDISLELEQGKILGLLGPNGSGKSTTIKMITGQIPATTGNILVDSKQIETYGININNIFGVMPQEIILWEHLTIEENLLFSGRLYGIDHTILKKRIEYLIDKLHLSAESKKLAKHLSGGYKRRLNLAISIIHDPKIILLDEPTPGIDPQSRNAMWEFIMELKNSKEYSILLTDHYLDEAEKVCDNILIIDNGQTIAQGTLAQLKKTHSNGKIIEIDVEDTAMVDKNIFSKFLDEVNINFPDVTKIDSRISIVSQNIENNFKNIFTILNKHNISYKDISIKEPSLEDIFLHLTGKHIRS
jgi:ABC-2 type transport system ATP-binding protein